MIKNNFFVFIYDIYMYLQITILNLHNFLLILFCIISLFKVHLFIHLFITKFTFLFVVAFYTTLSNHTFFQWSSESGEKDMRTGSLIKNVHLLGSNTEDRLLISVNFSASIS